MVKCKPGQEVMSITRVTGPVLHHKGGASVWKQCNAACATLCSHCSVAPAVRDISHQAVGWQGDGARHDAAIGADDVAQLAADLLAEVVTDLRSAAMGQAMTGCSEQDCLCTSGNALPACRASVHNAAASCSGAPGGCRGGMVQSSAPAGQQFLIESAVTESCNITFPDERIRSPPTIYPPSQCVDRRYASMFECRPAAYCSP